MGSAAADVLAEARGDASRRGARPRRARTREGESRVVRGVTARAQDGVRAGTVSSLLARPGRERRRTRIQGKRQTSERPRGWSWPWRRRRRRRRRKRRRRRRRKRRRRRRRKRRRRRRRRRRKRLRRRRRPRPRPRLRRVRGDASSRGRDREPRRVRARTRTPRRRRRQASSTSTRLGHKLGPTARLGVVRARVFGGCVGVVHARRDIRDVRGCRGGVRERRLAGVPRPGGAPDGVETFRLAETPRASLEDGGGVLRRRGSVSVPGDDGWTPDVDGRESAPAGAESAPTGAESAPAVAPAETAAAEAPVLPAAVAPAETVETPRPPWAPHAPPPPPSPPPPYLERSDAFHLGSTLESNLASRRLLRADEPVPTTSATDRDRATRWLALAPRSSALLLGYFFAFFLAASQFRMDAALADAEEALDRTAALDDDDERSRLGAGSGASFESGSGVDAPLLGAI